MRRLATCFAIASMLAGSSACGFFEEFWGSPEEISTIRVPVTIQVPQPLILQLPPSQVLEQMPTNADGSRELPQCRTAADQLCVPTVWPPALDLRDFDPSGQIARHSDSIDAIEVAAVRLAVSSNTLNIDLQPVEMRVGTPNDTFFSAPELATTPAVPAQTVATIDAIIAEENQAEIGATLADIEFRMGMGTSLFIPAGVTPNDGVAEARLQLDLVVVIQLIDGPSE